MEESHNKEPLKDSSEHNENIIDQHTESKDTREQQHNESEDINILITKIINQLAQICKNEKDEYDDDDEGNENIKWKSLEKLLESHNNITRIFIELAKRGEL